MAEEAIFTTIHVYMLEEGTDVWRPVDAIRVQEYVYQINPECTIPETESWQFSPGETVRCEEKQLDRGVCLVAVERFESSQSSVAEQ